MLTYTGRRNMFGNLCNNSATATLALADTLMNDSEKRIIAARDWTFLWKQYTDTTEAGIQAYTLPAYTRKPQGLYVTVGSYRYQPKEVTLRSDWDRLNEVTITSDIPTHCFFYDGQLLLHPVPSSAGNVITYNARRVAKDLLNADYAVGTIVTVATSGNTTTVTGSGVTWSAAMIGRWIRITGADAANAGDNVWYEIATVPSSTTLTLTRAYGGTAITAGSATYVIGEVSLIPEPHNQLPVFEALKIYFTSVDPNAPKAQLYDKMFKEGYANMARDEGSKLSIVLNDGEQGRDYINPNLKITL